MKWRRKILCIWKHEFGVRVCQKKIPVDIKPGSFDGGLERLTDPADNGIHVVMPRIHAWTTHQTPPG